MLGNPFDLTDNSAYQRWRDAKLATAPRTVEDIIVEVRDPRALTRAEKTALTSHCKTTNMAIYSGFDFGEDRTVPCRLGEQIGLRRLDHNRGAEEDDITSLRVVNGGEARFDFIPYTNRPLHWHTDGYYNSLERTIHGILLHCVRPALSGGTNALLDHELAYLLLREENPAHIVALSAHDAMTIPAYVQNGQELRPASSGPIFSVTHDGHLHMRYTARMRNVIWREEPVVFPESSLVGNTKVALSALTRILTTTPYVLHATLTPGQGLVCNNVLHDRSGFTDDPLSPRLLYRARYYDRISG